MLGVYSLYLIQKFRSPFVAESFILLMLGGFLSLSISIPSVLSNMEESGNFYGYFMMAFSHTEFLVQTTLILGLVALIFFLRNFKIHTVLKERFV